MSFVDYDEWLALKKRVEVLEAAQSKPLPRSSGKRKYICGATNDCTRPVHVIGGVCDYCADAAAEPAAPAVRRPKVGDAIEVRNDTDSEWVLATVADVIGSSISAQMNGRSGWESCGVWYVSEEGRLWRWPTTGSDTP